MKEDHFLSDFQITIDDKPIPCHKLMLAAHSPVIKGMLRSNMSEVAKQSMTLNHIQPDIMQILLDYMYCGQVTFHIDQLEGVIAACNYLQMTELQTMCVTEVPSTLTPDNAISWMQLGNQLDITDFKAQCEDIIATHLAEISSHRDFLEMTHAEVKDCLSGVSKSETAHDDDDLLQAALQWISQDAEDRLTNLENLLREIQLENCSQKAVLDVMKTHRRTVVANIEVYDLLTDALQQIATYDTEKLSPKFKAKVREMLMIVGGEVDSRVNPTCWYLNSSNQIMELCKIPYSDLALYHSICPTPGGFAVTGGLDSNLCIVYNAETKSWSRLQNLQKKRHRHGSICISGVLSVIGGVIKFQIRESVDCLALDGGKWENGPELPTVVYLPRVAHIKGIIYLLDSWNTKQLLELDPENNTWVRRATPPGGVDKGVSMTSVNDQLCVAGGGVRVCLWYSPTTDAWSKGQLPFVGHRWGSLVHHNSKIFLLGGQTYKLEELSIETGAWSVSSMKLPRKLTHHQAFVLDIPQQK